MTTAGGPLPFDGVKIADFSWVWAGPTNAKYLADHGATVVRVESLNRPDMVRAIAPYKDDEIRPNRTHSFNDVNTASPCFRCSSTLPRLKANCSGFQQLPGRRRIKGVCK